MFGWGKKKDDGDGSKEAAEVDDNSILPSKESAATSSGANALTGFDPSGLERAAEAAKRLDKSKNAKEALKLTMEQEKSSQLDSQAKIEENKARAKAFEVERVRAAEQERRKTMEYNAQMNRQQANYRDQLAKRRHQENLQAEQAMRAQELKRQEESQMRMEQLRRQTAQYEANLRKETEAARVEREIKGRILQERENHDLHMQRAKMEAKEFRETVLEAVRSTGQIVGDGVKNYMTDWTRLSQTVGALTLLAAGIYTTKVSTAVVGRFVEARLGKPPLIRETSRRSITQKFAQPIASLKEAFAKVGNAMEGVVLEPNLSNRLESLAISTMNTQKNKAPYRHMMLYGPPGTGKTLFARNLAKSSGMDYAILTGGDVAPLGRDGVTEMHRLFDWANTSQKGLLLFVDEADAFLRKRTSETLSEDLRNAVNAFLYRTGTASKKFMIVFATNQPEQLDWAVNDRTDEIVEFALPGMEERERMLRQFFEKYIANGEEGGGGMFGSMSSRKITIEDEMNDDAISMFATRTEGFSGRELEKLVIAWQAAAFGTPNCSINMDMMNQVVDYRVEQNIQKGVWLQDM